MFLSPQDISISSSKHSHMFVPLEITKQVHSDNSSQSQSSGSENKIYK